MKCISRIIICCTFTLTLASSPSSAEQQFVTVGTGGMTSIYYPTGRAICGLVNKSRKEHGVHCLAESTGGSVYNLNTIASGEFDMGIAQSDLLNHAYNGTSKFKKEGPNTKLRTIFSIYPEPFTVVARSDSGIKDFKDLKGKRVNIGNPGSGQRGTMEALMDAVNWTNADFKLALELRSSEQSKALCENKVDAMVFTVGHPNQSIKEASTLCDAVMVSVEVPEVDKLVAENEYYRKAIVPGGMYRGTDTDIPTFGVDATLVSSSDVPVDIIYNVVKAVFENFDQFRKSEPAFANLKKEDMIKNGLSAPLHDGAVKYYREVGLM
ncbi:TRAP transporter solute receptor, TAXI family [Desulfocapsa sulfexigens DSM 10523]|uniref:TRAP transporter solute receptor, TAXI family n=1 Tax=Desulfocapsa sulfexigens (strain DSM 10523 / SB164P1) TaxID=1167006 RepID=M1NII4_DESSD|nr:TAXI family TRAP transporter solute-binding subunit [Desulfocapsa sulfexigens]AGF79379.1 TRAP transporter solute receptor, TAXI family [Desulfocapsa sulfexigens DSM 10523]